jgi:hypothetical protein
MGKTVTIEIPAEREALFRRLLALSDELDHLAVTAPPGTVFDACEEAVISGGREVQLQLLNNAMTRCVEAAEKKGRHCEPVPVDSARKTAVPKGVKS